MGVVVYPVCDAAPVIKGKASEEIPVFFLPLFSSFSSLFFPLSFHLFFHLVRTHATADDTGTATEERERDKTEDTEGRTTN